MQEEARAALMKKHPSFRTEAGRWLRYLYFLRFSLLLWILPLLLRVANSPKAARSLVSGIVTPSNAPQYLCAVFFLIAGGFVALILARIVVINGHERFRERPPCGLVWLLANDSGHWEWVALLLSQLFNIVLFRYFFTNGSAEGVPPSAVWIGLIVGAFLAAAFWLAVSAFYYLTFQPGPGVKAQHFGKAAARTLIVPRRWLLLSTDGKPRGFGDVLEDACLPFGLEWIRHLFPVAGYRWPPDGNIFEGAYFSLVASFGFFGLYWVLWPLTAPTHLPGAAKIAIGLNLLGAAGIFVIVLLAQADSAHPEDAAKLRWWKALLAVPILGFAGSIPWLYYHYDAERFPILALILILLISLSWTVAATAFFADRYRIPVLTTLLALVCLLRIAHFYQGLEEHYLSIASRPTQAALPDPPAILDARLSQDPGQVLVVVTSTGGGIHAAAWTTAVLRQLEIAFDKDASAAPFHNHLLLVSTVSGGSAGLYAYLREINPATNGGQPNWDRMTGAASCSSLEAVGWGLVYYDVPKAILPFFPYLFPPSSGVDDLYALPLGKDRTWALRKAFARNLTDTWCQPTRAANSPVPAASILNDQNRSRRNEHGLTLANLSPQAGDQPFPAFTMNTTTVEGGARFLLANYWVPALTSPPPFTPPPAESFLKAYGGAHPPDLGADRFVDLPLATASQLSATFPYVSSAAAFPAVANMQSVHYVDGGYYDNDGTASAIEFLRSALTGLDAKYAKVRIVLVEIRNSPDPDPTPAQAAVEGPTPAQPASQARKPLSNPPNPPWNVNDQAVAPLEAFYGAGHDSVTDRNRNALILLQQAFPRLDLTHIVIDDTNAQLDVHTDPLNWSLTPKQQQEVETTANLPGNQTKYAQVWSFFSAAAKPAASQGNSAAKPTRSRSAAR